MFVTIEPEVVMTCNVLGSKWHASNSIRYTSHAVVRYYNCYG